MINRMAIRQMIADAELEGADSLILDIYRELLDEIEALEEKAIGIEA